MKLLDGYLWVVEFLGDFYFLLFIIVIIYDFYFLVFYIV